MARDRWARRTLRVVRPGAVDLLAGMCAISALVLLFSTYALLPGLTVFGNDEVHYYVDLKFKVPEDGRWLNYFLHDFLRSIPVGTWAVMLLASSWLLFFRLGISVGFEAPFAVLIASTILMAYPFLHQSLWPATTIPAVIILLVVGLFVDRGSPHSVIYLLSGVLLFGTMQSFYFLVPLFFLRQFIADQGSTTRPWPLLVNHMTWWIVGAIVGVLVMSFILWVGTGHFGVQPAAWRRVQPAHDVASFLHNTLYVARVFRDHVGYFVNETNVNGRVLAVILGVTVLLRAKALSRMYPVLLLLVAVMIAFFAFSIPLAPIMGGRSFIAMAAAIVLLIALLPGNSAPGRSLGALLLLTISYGFSIHSVAYLAQHEARNTFFYEKFRAVIPGQPGEYSAIALFGNMSDGAPEAGLFNEPSQMHPVMYALGARRYLDCRMEDGRCKEVGEGEPRARLPFSNGELVFSVDENNVAIIRYHDCRLCGLVE